MVPVSCKQSCFCYPYEEEDMVILRGWAEAPLGPSSRDRNREPKEGP